MSRLLLTMVHFRGDISVKLDTFSFGVVLLELLTSLPPYDEHRDGVDLVGIVSKTNR
jgi:interleukin-1 receptor-associated kinase 4